MTDEEKVELWETVCVENDLASISEFKFWLEEANVSFTATGSSVASENYLLNKRVLEKGLESLDSEGLATLVLEYITGVLIFNSIEVEIYFWTNISQVLQKRGIEVPQELVPAYIKNAPQDTEI